jgi:membrane protease YdiL (CAAX protease family)
VPEVIKISITPMALVAGALIGTWRMQLHPRSELGWRLPSARHALIFTVLFMALMAIHETLYQLFALDEQQRDWRTYAAGAIALRVVFVGLIYPLAEELFFRASSLA